MIVGPTLTLDLDGTPSFPGCSSEGIRFLTSEEQVVVVRPGAITRYVIIAAGTEGLPTWFDDERPFTGPNRGTQKDIQFQAEGK